MAALSAQDVWAVGAYHQPESPYQTLTEHWDGTRWRRVESPNRNPPDYIVDNHLEAVAGLAANDVWAIGTYQGVAIEGQGSHSTGRQPMTMHWTGTSWQFVDNPAQTAGSTLTDLAAVGPHDLWAVGKRTEGASAQAISLRWNGRSWEQVPVPGPEGATTTLGKVSGSGPNDVWAAGGYSSPTEVGVLVEHWDGAAWTPSTLPVSTWTTDRQHVFTLGDIASSASDDAWMVGSIATNGPSPNPKAPPPLLKLETVIMHWDGVGWTRVPAPNPGDTGADLFGVSVAGKTDAWAVGSAFIPGKQATLTLHWDGSTWAQVSSPDGDPLNNSLRDVTTLAGGHAWAAGYGALLQYTASCKAPKGAPPAQPTTRVPDPHAAGVLYFSLVGHTLREPFRAYWDLHGGLDQFGYPLTEPFDEISPTDGKPYLVQYFERNRLEYHPELPEAYRVSLGLLGVQILRARTWLP
ncbi:MAG: hypothetical protein M3328_13630 [Chloroflexota bacterium]|nr:hypothetical protein [Chloroflexota bacterium]